MLLSFISLLTLFGYHVRVCIRGKCGPHAGADQEAHNHHHLITKATTQHDLWDAALAGREDTASLHQTLQKKDQRNSDPVWFLLRLDPAQKTDASLQPISADAVLAPTGLHDVHLITPSIIFMVILLAISA